MAMFFALNFKFFLYKSFIPFNTGLAIVQMITKPIYQRIIVVYKKTDLIEPRFINIELWYRVLTFKRSQYLTEKCSIKFYIKNEMKQALQTTTGQNHRDIRSKTISFYEQRNKTTFLP